MRPSLFARHASQQQPLQTEATDTMKAIKRNKNVFEEKFSIEGAAQRAGVSYWTLWREIRRGRLGCYRIGGCVLVGRSHLERYLSDSEQAV